MRVCTGVCACVSAPASWPRRRAKTAVALRQTGKNRERLARISARALSWAAAPARTCPNTTQRSASPAASAVARCDGGVPPRLEGRGIHRGAGKRVLTSVATSEVQALVKRCRAGSSARKVTAARSRGSRGCRASWFLASQCPGGPRANSGSLRRCCGVLVGDLRSLSSFPPPPSPPASGRCGQGTKPPRWLGLGAPEGCGSGLL
jgi:hypothetical protein